MKALRLKREMTVAFSQPLGGRILMSSGSPGLEAAFLAITLNSKLLSHKRCPTEG